jgi:hypothetical protein
VLKHQKYNSEVAYLAFAKQLHDNEILFADEPHQRAVYLV